MKASEVMTRAVATLRPEATLGEAVRLMLERQISGLPVVDSDGALVGMLTEGDLLRRAETGTERRRGRWLELLLGPGRMADEYVRTHGRRVGEIMTREVVAVAEEAPLDEVVQLMERHRIKRVPVLRGGALVGILSRADLLRALAGLLEGGEERAGGDAAIREQVLAEIARRAWAPREGIAVTVKGGVVELDGVVTDDKERAALRVVAENVPGVKGVRDRLVWVEPVSGTVVEAEPENPEAATPPAAPRRRRRPRR
jgi:CBS domain-containing protein